MEQYTLPFPPSHIISILGKVVIKYAPVRSPDPDSVPKCCFVLIVPRC